MIEPFSFSVVGKLSGKLWPLEITCTFFFFLSLMTVTLQVPPLVNKLYSHPVLTLKQASCQFLAQTFQTLFDSINFLCLII